MATKAKVVSCRDAGSDCHFLVSDVDEAEVIRAAQDHAKRKHGMDVTAEQVKGIMKEEECPCCC